MRKRGCSADDPRTGKHLCARFCTRAAATWGLSPCTLANPTGPTVPLTSEADRLSLANSLVHPTINPNPRTQTEQESQPTVPLTSEADRLSLVNSWNSVNLMYELRGLRYTCASTWGKQ